MNGDLAKKYADLKGILRDIGSVAVAFSGGVDSSLLLRVACDELPEQVAAFFADSVVQPEGEKDAALAIAAGIGVSLKIIAFDLLADSEFRANSAERCYFCKRKIFGSFLKLCGGSVLVDGTNLDDLGEVRPGYRACQELGVRSPLLEAGLGKKDIRNLSRNLGLSTWNKPSASCLATRIAEGDEITTSRISIIARAEEYLHGQGFLGCRLRLHDKSGIVQLAYGDINRFAGSEKWQETVEFLRLLGLAKVFLDLYEREGILT